MYLFFLIYCIKDENLPPSKFEFTRRGLLEICMWQVAAPMYLNRVIMAKKLRSCTNCIELTRCKLAIIFKFKKIMEFFFVIARISLEEGWGIRILFACRSGFEKIDFLAHVRMNCCMSEWGLYDCARLSASPYERAASGLFAILPLGSPI